MSKNIHITPREKGWAVKIEGNQKASKVLPTQQEAIEAGRQKAKDNHSELLIHSKDGKINRRDSFGNDNFPPRG
ncbi:MAG: DUF2188 domain-containing protein [Spirosoma sp.]|nr:DUF2188 domain-containing protein [Spirosoma sp. 48-14]MBN8820825.1 DUF2188 domain-containing protein [Spirosoma sp.]OJW71570.1 MAG: hypothetical protein BGO59_26705 [Spirosoma sp. 48-14]